MSLLRLHAPTIVLLLWAAVVGLTDSPVMALALLALAASLVVHGLELRRMIRDR